MVRTNTAVYELEEKTKADGGTFWSAKTEHGTITIFDEEVAKGVRTGLGKVCEVEVVENNGFKNITAFFEAHGEAHNEVTTGDKYKPNLYLERLELDKKRFNFEEAKQKIISRQALLNTSTEISKAIMELKRETLKDMEEITTDNLTAQIIKIAKKLENFVYEENENDRN